MSPWADVPDETSNKGVVHLLQKSEQMPKDTLVCCIVGTRPLVFCPKNMTTNKSQAMVDLAEAGGLLPSTSSAGAVQRRCPLQPSSATQILTVFATTWVPRYLGSVGVQLPIGPNYSTRVCIATSTTGSTRSKKLPKTQPCR